ncbi:MAG: Gfo/Idh/MocA family oxidoreductase, partial [Planctomycetaceae bacterium]
IYVFGGGNYVPGYKAFHDVWSSADGRNWTRETEAAPWSARLWFSTATYRDRIWVLGGWSNNPSKNWGDAWYSADGKTWHQLETTRSWKERHEHSAYVFQDRLWIAGGHATPLSAEVWSIDIPADSLNKYLPSTTSPLSGELAMTALPRRDFLQTSGLAPLAALAPLGAARTASAAPNDKVVVAIIGLGGQGRGHVKSYASLPNVEVAYLCDVDDKRRAEAGEIVPSAKQVADLRTVLDDKAVDAVSIATPDHWHTPAALLALQAGKHVYVEKPCSHNVREGRWLVEAARSTGKLVQHGTQSRSAPFLKAAIQLLRDGVIGPVVVARAWNVQFRPPIGKSQPGTPPAGFDYDTWVGPAPFVPFQPNRHHYTWHWWYDFG